MITANSIIVGIIDVPIIDYQIIVVIIDVPVIVGLIDVPIIDYQIIVAIIDVRYNRKSDNRSYNRCSANR